ncbi:PKD/REJ-like domain [Trinorchestia longiramus]|nr:PKD/REJ-like domain [Trinorchestia longiramus]
MTDIYCVFITAILFSRAIKVDTAFFLLLQFESGQEIHLEPDLWRYCEQSSGATFRWVIYKGKEQIARFQTSTLLILPQELVLQHSLRSHSYSYSESLTRTIDGSVRVNSSQNDSEGDSDSEHRTSTLDRDYAKEEFYGRALRARSSNKNSMSLLSLPSRMLTSEFPEGVSMSPSGIGTYRVSLTVTEEDTVVHSSKNISFQVVEVPFSVKFLGGSSRWQARTNNITLWVEVRSPSPNYTLSWSCHFLRDPQTPCFITTDPWDHFKRTVRADTPFRKLERNYLLYRIWKMNQPRQKESVEVDENDHDNGNPDDSSSCEPNGSCLYENDHQMNSSTSENFDDDFDYDELSTSDGVEASGDLTSYIESLTFPCALLQPLAYELLFRVSVTQMLTSRPPQTAQQRIVLLSGPVTDVGIIRHFDGYLPFGATDRVVFESICFTCSREDLDHLSYKWSLSKIRDDATVARRHRRQFDPEVKDAAAEQNVADEENASESIVAHPRGAKLRDRAILDATEDTKKSKHFPVHGQSEFIVRFQDYVRLYWHNSSIFFDGTLNHLREMVTNVSSKSKSNVISTELSLSEVQPRNHEEEAQSKVKMSPLKFADKLMEKKQRSAESSFGAPAGKLLSNAGVQKTSLPAVQSEDPHSTFEMLSSASLLHAGFLLKYERESVEFVEGVIGGTIDSVLIDEARKLFLRSRQRRIAVNEKDSISKEAVSSIERVVEHIYKKETVSNTSVEIETTSEFQQSTGAKIPSDSLRKEAEMKLLRHVSEKKLDVKRDLETMIGASEQISPVRVSTNSAEMNRGLQSSSLKLVSEQTRDKRVLNSSGRKLPGTTGVLEEKGRLRLTVDRLNGARRGRSDADEVGRTSPAQRPHYPRDRE